MKIPGLATVLLVVPVIGNADLDDSDRARRALERGEVLPLREILGIVEREIDGRIIEVEFEAKDGGHVYEFEFIAPDGRLLEAVVDARTGRVISVGEDDDD
ncbi:PepSY domain-containing protein [Amaricoccus solimangrovi]|uniref:Peptidase M4 n=1 Tax=Amaricoccus solimangrovi TaxID=2589815 RepID=A0A501WDN4_9RHOB|nr:PepSY domain-containing protein [Amaricoccus solimangrovi]TPE47699.1 peptidase M4 [Amaricoccus solimangrovi]